MSISSFDLSKRFILLMAGLILITAFSTRTFYTRQERTDLDIRLKEKATFINNFYSFLIADSLMRKDDVTLFQVVNRLEEDPEISSVVVVDQNQAVRYHADPQKVGTLLDESSIKAVLASGGALMTRFQNAGGQALALVSPLKVQGAAQPIGAVRIEFTYRHIDDQISASQKRFWFIILGSIVTCAGLVTLFVSKWVLLPLQSIRVALAAINPALPETNLLETRDEIGQVSTAINDLVLRFKNESQQQWDRQLQQRAGKMWVSVGREQLHAGRPGDRGRQRKTASYPTIEWPAISRRADGRLADGVPAAGAHGHLMDLIKDSNFATLLTTAFQKEGEVVRGPVTFQEKSYMASILSVPHNNL